MPDRVYSLAEVKRRLMHPDVSVPLNLSDDFVPFPDLIYYALGDGLVIYRTNGDVAVMHGALVGGFKKGYAQEVKAQWKDLGVCKVISRFDRKLKKSSFVCSLLGMRCTVSNDTFKQYEVCLNELC